jgi:hypothetical protein
MLRKMVGAVALAAVTLASTAQAGGSGHKREFYSSPGRHWQVDYLPELNTCVVGRPHQQGTKIQIMYLPETDSFLIMITNAKWSSIKDGGDYKLRMVMDGGADKWQGAAKGVWTFDGVPGLAMGPLSMKFIKSFMNRNYVDISNGENGDWVTGMPLDGTYAAVSALVECLDAHGAIKNDNPPPQRRQQKPEWST